MESGNITASQKDDFIDQYKQQLAVAQTQELLSVSWPGILQISRFRNVSFISISCGSCHPILSTADHDREVLQEVRDPPRHQPRLERTKVRCVVHGPIHGLVEFGVPGIRHPDTARTTCLRGTLCFIRAA